MRVLVLYGSTYGHTSFIAQRIADTLSSIGHEADIANADHPAAPIGLAAYDAAVIGSSVIGGKHRRSVQRFVAAHHDELNAMPSAFFSVSASAAGQWESQQLDARHMLDTFLLATGWQPRTTATIAGAMSYTKYNPFVRWMMRRISKKAGGPTDTSRDHELTDWTRVSRFVGDFITTLDVPPVQNRSPAASRAALPTPRMRDHMVAKNMSSPAT
ncbi:MAG: flavodoxin domain-containing protein [Gemmatimonadaceae bacterium]